MLQLEKILTGGDLRSIGKSNAVVTSIQSQQDFDELFNYMFHPGRVVIMRAADAVEKITLTHPGYLVKHKKEILDLCGMETNKELKWHLALLVSRLLLKGKEPDIVWNMLTKWATDKTNSRIVRVNSLQGLFEMTKQHNKFKAALPPIFLQLEKENIPSLNARVKKLKVNYKAP